MPESTCLHIQDRPSGPIRVVELPWMTVRIGRAAYCEVRLDEAGLADEVCRLQRRGRTWNLVPLSLKGARSWSRTGRSRRLIPCPSTSPSGSGRAA